MKSLLKNRKGLYEYILTKSVMLIFILGLVVIFYNLYNNLNVQSAANIVNDEAARIAKEIDDVISFKGVSSKTKVYLSRDLSIGKDTVAYTLRITDEGVVILNLSQAPYSGTMGIAKFGINMKQKQEGLCGESIMCEWDKIQKGAYLEIAKTSKYSYQSDPSSASGGYRLYEVTVNVDATHPSISEGGFGGCGSCVIFEESFCEDDEENCPDTT